MNNDVLGIDKFGEIFDGNVRKNARADDYVADDKRRARFDARDSKVSIMIRAAPTTRSGRAILVPTGRYVNQSPLRPRVHGKETLASCSRAPANLAIFRLQIVTSLLPLIA